jgi:hypothetical protein
VTEGRSFADFDPQSRRTYAVQRWREQFAGSASTCRGIDYCEIRVPHLELFHRRVVE